MTYEEPQIQEKSPERTAYLDAIALLARRDYSRYKLKQKLIHKGHDRHEIDETIEELVEKKYLQEELYQESRVKGLIHKGLSKSHIQQKVQEERCPTEMEFIEQVYADMQTSEEEQIAYLVEKKIRFATLESYEQRQKAREKALRYVISKGHSYSAAKTTCETVMQKYLDNHEQ